MRTFLDTDFLLDNDIAVELYHDYAAPMPIIDYHCHLPPLEIAADKKFQNITGLWLNGDHYKWRAMRAAGVNEYFITGGASDEEKFMKWAETVPYTWRNPLFHWTHLELQRYFGIKELLNPDTASHIYQQCNAMLTDRRFSVRNLLQKMKVELVCTTDDPVDDLAAHKQLHEEGFTIKVIPAFRPDAAMNVDHASFNSYIDKLASVTGIVIEDFGNYLRALQERHQYFSDAGCVISDHGLEEVYADDFTHSEIVEIFSKLRTGRATDITERRKFKSAMLYHFAEWDHSRGWVQQYHLGAMRNNNSRMMKQLGADTGWDSIGDFSQARSLSRFLDALDSKNKLARTILYNLNPADNEVMATMTGNFNDGSIAGKIQWGSAWWFLDQKDGIIKQINALSNMGLLSRFVGMLTDSRSFLSYPRHEYFRRILCNLFGSEIEKGELPNDIRWAGKLVQDICYYNAKKYFGQ